MKLPAYPRTKPSGVEWLGDVPEHWEVNRLRWVGEAIIGLTYSPTDVVSEGEGTLVHRSSNIQAGRIVLDDNVFVAAEIPQRLRTKANDIVICTRNGSRDLVGKTGKISERESGLTFGAFTAVFRSPANDYMFYVFNSGLFSFQAGLYQTSTVFQLTNGTINAFQIPLPPPAEQRSIALFLDRETGRVDRLVAKKRELVERLKEKRTALISRTVTRGLPPAAARAAGLPANPPLKPSALDWLGDIPAHWEVKKLGYGAYLQGGYAFASEKFDSEGVPVVRMNNLKRGVLDTSDASCVAPENCLDDFALAQGDLLWGMSGSIGETGSLGNFARVAACDLPAQLNQRVGRFCVIGDSIALGFLTYVIQTKFFYDQILLPVTGTAQFNVSSEQVQSAKVPFPPLPEQAAIAAYLDEETAKLDALVGKVEEAVERLQEYRTALITAAVTGKIDVRANSKPTTFTA